MLAVGAIGKGRPRRQHCWFSGSEPLRSFPTRPNRRSGYSDNLRMTASSFSAGAYGVRCAQSERGTTDAEDVVTDRGGDPAEKGRSSAAPLLGNSPPA